MPDDPALRIFPDEFVPNVQASKTYQRWAKSSPGDHGRWEAFRDALLAGQEPSVPSMSTTFGRALVAAGKEHMSISQLVGTVTDPYPVGNAGLQFYVSTTGSDTGDGSSARPWRTIRNACLSVPANQGATINVAAGNYVETATCSLPSGTNLVGAGQAQTVVSAASAFNRLLDVLNTTQPQTISDLTLDGSNRTTCRHGLWAQNVNGLKILRVTTQSFQGSGETIPSGLSGGGINLQSATDCEIGWCISTNSGSSATGWCTGDMGLGYLTRCVVHDCSVTTSVGYAVKAAGAQGATYQDVRVYNCTFAATSSFCSSWNTLCFEIWSPSDVRNFEIRNCSFNRSVSLVGGGGALGSGRRYIFHHNNCGTASDSYAVELNVNSSDFHHNFFNGGGYVFAEFGTDTVQDNNIYNNVFDNQNVPGGALAMHINGRALACDFTDNTVVVRNDPRDEIMQFGEMWTPAYTGSTGTVLRNIFKSTGPSTLLAKSTSLSSFTIDSNGFHGGVTATGTNQTTTDPLLPLTGGFPAAYVPASGDYSALGAMASGSFSVGPS